jgi:hypothetical protein
VKGPAADATDALQPCGLLCNPMMKMKMMIIFCPFPSNGAPVELNWQGKTCPSATLSTTNPTWTDPGSNPGLRGGRSAANRLSHGINFRSRGMASFEHVVLFSITNHRSISFCWHSVSECWNRITLAESLKLHKIFQNCPHSLFLTTKL